MPKLFIVKPLSLSPAAAVPRCQAIPSQPYLRVEVARSGRDKNYTYSAGARIKVTCLHGYGLNIGNKTAKCAKGKWKPKKPECVTREYLRPLSSL